MKWNFLFFYYVQNVGILCYSHLGTYKMFHTVADWDSMVYAIKQTFRRAFQTLGWAFSFLLNPQKLGRVFQKLGRVFKMFG